MHSALFTLCLAVGLSLFAALPGSLYAQDSSEYRALIDSALEEYELRHYEEARSLFERAHALSPSARTLRGVGMAAYQARKYVIAIGYLQAALVDPRKPLTAQFRREVKGALEQAQGFIARYELQLEPAGASIMVDGEAASADDGWLQLDPGEHEIVASAAGYRTEVRHIKVASGHSGRIELRLSSELPLVAASPQEQVITAGSAAPAPAPAPDKTEGDVSVGLKSLTIGGFSLALAGAVVGTVTGVKALSEENQLAEACPEKTCSSEQADRLDDAKQWGTISTASLAVGGAGLVAGVVGLVLWTRGKRGRERAQGSSGLTPLISVRGIGLRGRF